LILALLGDRLKRQNMARKMMSITAAATILIAQSALATPANPGTAYSDSKLTGAASTASATTPQDASVTGQVSTWVKSKWSSYWGGGAQDAKQPASKAAQETLAPSHTVVSDVVAPPIENARSAPNTSVAKQADRSPAASAVAATTDSVMMDDPTGLERKSNGVAVYDLSSSDKIPRIHVGNEKRVTTADYALDSHAQSTFNSRVIAPFPSPDLLLSSQLKTLTAITTGPVGTAAKTKDVVFAPKGKVSREAFDKIVRNLAPERPLALTKFKNLTSEEMRFLSGLLLYQQGDKCPVAVGLFHKLSKSKGYEAEADYYLAMCSRKLGLATDFYDRARRILDTQDVYYSRKILKEVGYEVPYEFVDSLGLALFKASSNPKIMEKLDAKTEGNVAFILADFGASTERYKTALEWAKKVPVDHPRHLQAQFIEALADYQTGLKPKAMALQEELIKDISVDKQKSEFQALVALNAARMYFQEQKFKEAHQAFLKVNKDHPLWLQSLNEMGWSQLMSGDFEGAIGNMYSIQSPFFSAVYKPESYVIRTIGYLNLCQYGDAYKSLSMMEREYRPSLEKMEKYTSSHTSYYQTVRNFMNAPKKATEVDGLPLPIVREMARHRDFTNLQKALNRQVDEKALYSKIDGEAVKGLKKAQWLVSNSRKRIAGLRTQLAKVNRTPALEGNRAPLNAQLEKEMDDLNDYFFQVDLYTEASEALPAYRQDVVGGADVRLAKMHAQMENVLSNRLLQMKTDLARYIDNNELLRYEVFSGAGENIRFQVSGGDTAKRVASSVIPKSKSLQWDFDGEYWEDEIGHYRSGLKNNCAGANGNVQVKQANLEGADE
jgi:tetratricopeptide (TPR) repeat protein